MATRTSAAPLLAVFARMSCTCADIADQVSSWALRATSDFNSSGQTTRRSRRASSASFLLMLSVPNGVAPSRRRAGAWGW
ncbi:MAG TPA: hypothetical protein VN033_15335 [Vulgatibacter sp.]|nr:hypothetical protein [Vulgatibacter sp.]